MVRLAAVLVSGPLRVVRRTDRTGARFLFLMRSAASLRRSELRRVRRATAGRRRGGRTLCTLPTSAAGLRPCARPIRLRSADRPPDSALQVSRRSESRSCARYMSGEFNRGAARGATGRSHPGTAAPFAPAHARLQPSSRTGAPCRQTAWGEDRLPSCAARARHRPANGNGFRRPPQERARRVRGQRCLHRPARGDHRRRHDQWPHGACARPNATASRRCGNIGLGVGARWRVNCPGQFTLGSRSDGAVPTRTPRQRLLRRAFGQQAAHVGGASTYPLGTAHPVGLSVVRALGIARGA